MQSVYFTTPADWALELDELVGTTFFLSSSKFVYLSFDMVHKKKKKKKKKGKRKKER